MLQLTVTMIIFNLNTHQQFLLFCWDKNQTLDFEGREIESRIASFDSPGTKLYQPNTTKIPTCIYIKYQFLYWPPPGLCRHSQYCIMSITIIVNKQIVQFWIQSTIIKAGIKSSYNWIYMSVHCWIVFWLVTSGVLCVICYVVDMSLSVSQSDVNDKYLLCLAIF